MVIASKDALNCIITYCSTVLKLAGLNLFPIRQFANFIPFYWIAELTSGKSLFLFYVNSIIYRLAQAVRCKIHVSTASATRVVQ